MRMKKTKKTQASYHILIFPLTRLHLVLKSIFIPYISEHISDTLTPVTPKTILIDKRLKTFYLIPLV